MTMRCAWCDRDAGLTYVADEGEMVSHGICEYHFALELWALIWGQAFDKAFAIHMLSQLGI